MTKSRRLYLVYMWNAFVFLIVFGIAAFAAMAAFRDINLAYAQLFFAVPFLLGLEIRRRSQNIFIFFGASFALFVIVCTLAVRAVNIGSDYDFYAVHACTYMAVITLISFFKRFSRSEEDISIPFLVLAVVINTALSAASGLLELSGLEPVFIGISLVQVLLFVVYVRILRLDTSLELIESTTTQPISSILRFNNVMTVVFLVLIICAGILSVLLNTQNLLIYMGRALLSGMRYLASLSKPGEHIPEEPIMPEKAAGGGFDPSMFGEMKEPSFIAKLIEQIFIYGAWIAIIVGVVFGIGYLLYGLYKRFATSLADGNDEKEFLISEILTERTGGFVTNIREYLSRLIPENDNGKKVRRIFYKRVSAHISKGVEINTVDTPLDIETKIQQKEDISSLTEVYRKARYSSEQVTDYEVASCKRH